MVHFHFTMSLRAHQLAEFGFSFPIELHFNDFQEPLYFHGLLFVCVFSIPWTCSPQIVLVVQFHVEYKNQHMRE
jgi:hypothetical protein